MLTVSITPGAKYIRYPFDNLIEVGDSFIAMLPPTEANCRYSRAAWQAKIAAACASRSKRMCCAFSTEAIPGVGIKVVRGLDDDPYRSLPCQL